MKLSQRVSADLPGVVHQPQREEMPQPVDNGAGLSFWALVLLPLFALVLLILRSAPRRLRATVTQHKPSGQSMPPTLGQSCVEAPDVDSLEAEIHAFYASEDGPKH